MIIRINSWVFLFSKFTSEALLFEILIILFLICSYTAFWVLKKRRYGSIDTAIPSGPIKSYLNELIMNAEQLRLQLFGLLASNDPSTNQLYRLVGLNSLGTGADQAKISDLELKLAEQAKSLQALGSEKANLEKELAQAQSALNAANASGQAGSSSGDSATITKLQQKVTELEEKLAEYNVIEDDLANLKRLQQENILLKNTLTAKGIPLPTPGSTAPMPSMASITPSPAQTPAPAEAAAASPAAEASAAPASGGTAPNEPPAPDKKEDENTEADLVAEFEKMLKT